MKKKEIKTSTSVRLKPSTIEKLSKKYGSLTKWINKKLREEGLS